MSKIKQPTKAEILDMLEQSNAIEQVHGAEALKDAYTAWKYGLKNTDKLTVDTILGIHKLLMKNLEPGIAGKIRNCDVYIGGQRKWFLTETIIKEELQQIINLINSPQFGRLKRKYNNEGKEDDYAKHVHVMFENIHPFTDGNGRAGRCLYNIHRLKLGLPLHIIHADWPLLEGEQRQYYSWFR